MFFFQETKTINTMPKLTSFTPQRTTISLEKAVTGTTNWRMILYPFMNDNVIRGFYIPIQDIVELGKMHQECEGVRGYFSLEEPEKFTSVKMILVPVDKNGHDILSKPAGDNGEEESTIYDFTQPCPHLCDTVSPLY